MEACISFESGQKIVHGKYNMCHNIGNGTQSSVYSISLQKKGRNIMRAIKVENEKVASPQISTQVSVLKCIEGAPNADIGFPKFFEYGFEGEYNYMVMELLGPNLEQFMKLCGSKLSLKTVLILGLQMIDRIEVLHNAGYVYKDIRPENWVMGLENNSHILHLIDFGKCKRYTHKQTGKHLPYKENCHFDGEHIFSSINTHNKTEYSRRDDIEAIVYLIIYLIKGKLPWCFNKEFKSKKQRDTMIEEIKKKLPVEHLTYKLPLTFNDLLSYIRTLNYYERPDYDYIRLLLHRGFSDQEDNLSMVFDWNNNDPMDFAIYGGQPKIVLKAETKKTEQDQQYIKELSNMQIKESNSIDEQLMKNKLKGSIKKDGFQKQKQSAIKNSGKHVSISQAKHVSTSQGNEEFKFLI